MNSSPVLRIGNRTIGGGHPVYLVAEMSGNHGQSLDQAIKILEAAKAAGADGVKLQTYTADTMTIDSDLPCFRIKGTIWNDRKLHELYREAYTPWEWQPELQKVSERLGLDFFSTPFDASSVDFLEKMNVPVHKVASFENGDLPLLKKIAATGKPVILSTGMAELEDIELAVHTLREGGSGDIALLKCTSSYPAPPEEMNLRCIPHLSERFKVVVGLSDHTLTSEVPIAAVALGARIIEKHFTLDRSIPGPDSKFSLEPKEFLGMAQSVRTLEKALGEVRYGPTQAEKSSLVFRRSVFVTSDVRKGEVFTAENVRCIRPGNGLPPKHYESVLGKTASRDIIRGTPFSWDLLSEKK